MNVNIRQPPNKWNLLWFLHFKMWYIKFLACLIDWKDVLSIRTHLNITVEIVMFVRQRTNKKKKRTTKYKGKKKQQPTRNPDTQAGRILLNFFHLSSLFFLGMYRKILELPFVKDHLFPLKRFVNYLFALVHSLLRSFFSFCRFTLALVICNWWWASVYAT